jgi:hypothetical protein
MDLRNRLEIRLVDLRGELDVGRRTRAALLAEVAETERTMLRISGAILLLEEELAAPERAGGALDVQEAAPAD